SNAKQSLLQAAQKAPVAKLGFLVQCNKWAIIVWLLLGEIPKRTIFFAERHGEGFETVQISDLELLKHVAKQLSSTFNSERTHNLIVKL
ncbi:putative 26s proteasome non-atpase regulatory subunit 3, partial [Quercus suber]